MMHINMLKVKVIFQYTQFSTLSKITILRGPIDNSYTHFIGKKCRLEIILLKLKVIYKILLYITELLVSTDKVYKSNKHLLYVVRDLCLYRL